MRHRRQTAIIIAVLVFPAMLAVLQYYWIGQVSEAEDDRLRAGLRAATMRLSGEFNDEIRRAFGALLAGPDRSLNEDAEDFARWKETAREPRLVRDFYMVRIEDNGALSLLKLDVASLRFKACAWPPRFEPLREQLQTSPAPPDGRGLPGRPMGAGIDGQIPAIVAPRMRRPEQPGMSPVVPGWTIAELDLAFIQRELLPALVRECFPPSGDLDYQIQIIRRDQPDKVIYQSDPTLPAGFFSSPDAVGGLLDVRPDFPGRPGPPGQWRILAKNRSGPLEMVVQRARYRNLAISFAVLVIMAGSMLMLVRYTDRARNLARLQMEFVAGVSHELRTPLTVIRSAADNLADGLISDQQQARRYGTVIRNEGRRLSEMVDQILGFAGVESGRMKMDLEPVEVALEIERVVASAEPGCQIETNLDPDLPPVLADANLLRQCLQNLLSNALKYGNGDQWIGVRAQEAAGGVEISVEDRGPGIDPGEISRIFEPFYRGRDAVAAQVHGTGLGLSLVKRIMAAHSGTVTAASKPGHGSRFTLRFPVADGPRESVEHGTKNSVG